MLTCDPQAEPSRSIPLRRLSGAGDARNVAAEPTISAGVDSCEPLGSEELLPVLALTDSPRRRWLVPQGSPDELLGRGPMAQQVWIVGRPVLGEPVRGFIGHPVIANQDGF